MTDSELVAFLGTKIDDALNDDDGDISSARSENFDNYMGEKVGPLEEREGHSSYVSREVLEGIEWAKPSLLRIFTAGDRVVVFDPVNQQDEPRAEQETDVINHYLLKENDGFMTFYSWFTDALMNPASYVKVYPDESERVVSEPYSQLSEQQLAMLMQDEDYEVTEAMEEVLMTPQGPAPVYSLKGKRTITEKRLVVEPVPGEQVLIDDDYTKLNLDDCNFVCHRVPKSFTDLVNEGYDPDDLRDVGTDRGEDWGSERTNRLFYDDESPDSSEEDHEALRKYWVHECYVRVDFDGDGLAERRRIVMIGDQIFENEEDEYQPMVALSSLPIPHKHAGLSLADLLVDLQQIKSTLMRQLLDNLYKLGGGRKIVAEGALTEDGETLDQIQDLDSEVIIVRDINQITDEQVPNYINHILPVIEAMTDSQQVRTGITPQLSLDPSVLQQSTMGAFKGALEQASQRVEMIARIFAETGVKTMMLKAHQVMREHFDRAKALKIAGQWVDVNPSEWGDRTNVSVNVGLGFNNKEQQMQLLMGLINMQKEDAQFGLSDPQKMYNARQQFVEAAGLKNVERYFVDPSTVPPQPPQEDPMAELQKSLAETERLKAVTGMQKVELDRLKAQLKAEQDENEGGRKMAESAANIELKRAQAYKTIQEAEQTDLVDGVIDGYTAIR